MSRKCDLIANKGIQFGNHVSHSKRKTRRKFLPNLNSHRLYSDILGFSIKFKASHNSIRTLDRYCGLDEFLINVKPKFLSFNARKIRSAIIKKRVCGANDGN